MKKYHSLILENVGIDREEFIFNDFMKIKQLTNKSSLLIADDKFAETYEASPLLIYRTFQLALSNMNIVIKKDKENKDEFIYNLFKESGSPIMNYYASRDLNPTVSSGEIILSKEDLERVKEINLLLVEYNSVNGNNKNLGEWKPNRWNYAYEQYLAACRAKTIDVGVLHLITGLESLLVKGEGLLKFKVSLYTSIILGNTIEERKSINKKINFMYNLRSKVVHGEIDSVVKITSKPDIFEKYFDLKDILAKLLVKTYGMEENYLFDKLDEILFEVPKF
ncbi:hypothetical protein [Priestia megaterium]|uniref:hypothetical protein n=1 Tax=Priestia megaterium TaxID=1404 RepID=UPI003F7E3227